MSLDFNDFININHHYYKVEHGAQKIRDIYAPKPGHTKQYVHELFDFFMNDIKKVASDIYDEILHSKAKNSKSKFSPSDLNECIRSGTSNLLISYKRIISSLKTGGMFRDYENFDNDISSFYEEVESLCKKQGEIFEIKYRELLNTNRRAAVTHCSAIIGAIMGVGSFIWTALKSINFEEGG